MFLYDTISSEDRAEVERRSKRLPCRVENRGFNKPHTYGLSFPVHAQYFGGSYAQRQERLYKYVMRMQKLDDLTRLSQELPGGYR